MATMTNYLSDFTRRMVRAEAQHTSGMIALVPSETYIPLLVQPGGEPEEELHVTLAYLGEAANWSDNVQVDVVEAMTKIADSMDSPAGNVWAVGDFNPKSEERCIAYLVGGLALEEAMKRVRQPLQTVWGDLLPVQHAPWVPHITLGYGISTKSVDYAAIGQTVVFDRLRVAFAGMNYDLPIGTSAN